MHRRAIVRGLVSCGLLVAVTILSLPAARALATPAQSNGSTLVVLSGADAVTLDPMLSLDGQSPLLWRAAYESLLTYDGPKLGYRPLLATSWSVSTDGLTYIFHIRPGVTFSDGTPLDAAAVKLSIDRLRKLNQGVSYAFSNVSSVDTPGKMTVRLRLSKPFEPLLSAFAGDYAAMIISPKVIQSKDLGQSYLRTHMDGTGPYLLQSYVQSQRAVFVANPHYWRGWSGSHFNKIVIAYVHDPSTERLLLDRGEGDIALFLPDDTVNEMQSDPGVTVTDIPSLNEYYIYLPTFKGPTKSRLVRQAIAYAFDYQQEIKDNLQGHARQARGPIPSTFLGYDPHLPMYSYNPAKARALLKEAGYPHGGFTLKLIYEHGYFWKRPVAELLQSNLAALGIKLDIQELSPSTWASTLSNKATAGELAPVVWWPTLRTPWDYLYTQFATAAQGTAGYNFSYYSNPQFDRLLQEGVETQDPAKAQAIWDQAQQILDQDVPALFLYEGNYRLPMRSDIGGFVFNGIDIETFDFYALYRK
jgi:peptide/nickel transport system substrate-binding protein